ncbi:MAG: VIT1/CCC1 transporter family protein [Promethearchaeota archaeon]
MSKKSQLYSGVQKTFARWRNYIQITELGQIIRRYFVMNAFDGVLTSLGLIISNFALFIAGTAGNVTSQSILITGYATTIAIGISGLTGAYLTETAELRRSNLEIKEAMAVFMQDKSRIGNHDNEVHLKESDYYPEVDLKGKKLNTINGVEIEHVDIDPVPIKTTLDSKELRKNLKLRKRGKKEEKSLSEKAESFSSTIAALIDGFSPALGSFFGFIPFFFADTPTPLIYGVSLFIEVAILFTLGAYLAKISEDKIWIYGLSMVATGIFTSLIGFVIVELFGGG